MIPAFTSLLINYDPRVVNYGALKERLEKLLKLEVSQETAPSRIFDIPVCYGGEYGPDLENIAMHANLSTQEVIDIHSSEDYLILHARIPSWIFLSWGTGRTTTHQDLQIRVLRFRQEASASAVPRRESIRSTPLEAGSFWG